MRTKETSGRGAYKGKRVAYKALIPEELWERVLKYLDSDRAKRGETRLSLIVDGLEMKMDQLDKEAEKK